LQFKNKFIVLVTIIFGCHILRLKCTEIRFGWGSAPDPTGELTALPRPLAGFFASLLLIGGGRGREAGEEKGRGGKRKGRAREKRRGKGSPWVSASQK